MKNNHKDKLRVTILALLGVLMFAFGVWGTQPAKASPGNPPPPNSTPHSTPTSPPGGGGVGGGGTSISQVFHFLRFEDSTISNALDIIFGKVAISQDSQVRMQIAKWTETLGTILQAPVAGTYTDFAGKSIPVAAALAPALFILRLALYHWNKLLGDANDAPMRVIGDWITASLLALVAGPFLDLIIRVGWWTVGAMISPPANLARDFVTSLTVSSFIQSTSPITGGGLSWMDSLLGIVLGLAALLAVGGLILALVIANATLFILASIGPIVAVGSSLDELKWLRFLWIKAVVMMSLMPVVAGVIFNAGLTLPGAFNSLGHGGILSGIIRVIFLFAATGALLSLCGILGKLTLGTSADAAKGIFKAAGNIVATAGLAMSGAGVAAAPAAMGGGAVGGATAAGTGTGVGATPAISGGAVGANSSGSVGGGAGGSGGGAESNAGGAGGGSSSAFAHLGRAQTMNTASTALDAMGLKGASRFASGLGRGHELAARQDILQQKVERFGSGDRAAPKQERPAGDRPADLGFRTTQTQSDRILDDFKGSDAQFRQVYFGDHGVADFMNRHTGNLNPEIIAQQHADEIGGFTRAFQDMNVDASANPEDVLYKAASDAGANGILGLLGRG